jgi:UDP-2,4-diacetamido-2,4,6-trideoxy-beta-L-altropyranose hydrolase
MSVRRASEILVIRADASTAIGTGHVLRCVALAQEWQSADGQALFCMQRTGQSIVRRLESEGIDIAYTDTVPGSCGDAKELVELCRRVGAAALVIDGYQFGSDYQRIATEANIPTLCVDDHGHAGHYFTDFVLNQNTSVSALLYASREPYTQLLLGSDYALLRREFIQRGRIRRIQRARNHAVRLLVTMGGSDPGNFTSLVIAALGQLDCTNLEIRILVGGENPHIDALQQLRAQARFQICHNVSDVPGLLAWADLVVSAAGTTCWELAYLGVPMVLVAIADNQLGIASTLAERGIAIDVGWYADPTVMRTITKAVTRLIKDEALRCRMSEEGRKLIDGLGAARVVALLRRADARSLVGRPHGQ